MRRLSLRRRGGFTIIELMIVVALMGILAAVAIPSFLVYQARSRRTEAYSNLVAVARAQITYQADRGIYFGSGLSYPDPVPNGGLGIHTMEWDAASEAAFGPLGWRPEGRVYYTYETNTPEVPGSGCNCTLCFTATAFGDVDGNGMVSTVMFTHPQPDGGGGFDECPARLLLHWAPTRPGTGNPIYDEAAVNRSNDDF